MTQPLHVPNTGVPVSPTSHPTGRPMDMPWFHPGELTAQRLAGGGPPGAAIRDHMPDQHQAFFAALRYLAIATTGRDGWPAATLLTGEPGFVHAPDPVTLRIEFFAAPWDSVPFGLIPSDPLQADPTGADSMGAARMGVDPTRADLAPGQEIGILGIDFATRRRNRANGRLATVDAQGLTVAIRQSFGNCPQYIQRRSVVPAARVGPATETLATLDDMARRLIGQADTFFVASRSQPASGMQGGADISHRGGRPGFVRIEGDTLSIPDFRGNRYFNTFGNLLGEPRAALLFLDFEAGDLLHLQGEAEIDWTDGSACQIEGAERCWRFQIARGWRRRAAVPLRWSFVDQAPTTARTGVWNQD